jgi:8-oxo-dGTP pyrophosphatase MutT (NUDIX family)
MRKFTIMSKEEKYSNPWMAVKEYKIERDGKPGIYSVVERPDSAAIVAATADGRILFVKQYRFPTESYSWELPMGGVDAGEDPADSAARELREETGLDIPVGKIGSFHPIPGLTPQKATAFYATIPDSAIPSISSFDETVDEIVERKLFSEEEIKHGINTGEISDGFTLCALALFAYLSVRLSQNYRPTTCCGKYCHVQ